ncbi:hypothetical protein RchiOBHm_Chr1g0328661 [Rosa chinensis]|uniref:Uncharacterized protein n=1 Tax=Rosa chinensis TaxID=74649 RepID=A0A2P6SAV7_ROSCH|nr:hypothetical protein RchiOBHm_Chr1g0328661 [Rosa chinensis]
MNIPNGKQKCSFLIFLFFSIFLLGANILAFSFSSGIEIMPLQTIGGRSSCK